MNKTKIKIIIPFGKPCAGKDSLSNNIRKKNKNSEIISTGQLIRDAKKRGKESPCFKFFKEDFENVDNAGLAKDENIIKAVTLEVNRLLQEGNQTLILSGFPRTIPQLKFFQEMVNNLKNKFDIETKYFYLTAEDETVRNRANLRIEDDEKNGRIPRKEDVGDNFNKRLKDFNEQTLPLIESLEHQGQIIFIDANESTIEEVFKEANKHLEGYYPSKEKR